MTGKQQKTIIATRISPSSKPKEKEQAPEKESMQEQTQGAGEAASAVQETQAAEAAAMAAQQAPAEVSQTPAQEAAQESATQEQAPTQEEAAAATEQPAQEEPAAAQAEQPAADESTQAAPVPAKSAFEQKLDRLLVEGTSLEKMIVSSLIKYVESMHPGKMLSAQELNQNQLNLWRLIRLAIESEKDFDSCYPLIIEFAREYKDAAFHDRYLYRGMENINMDKDNLTYFLGSLNVIKLAATSRNKREAMAQVDLSRVMNEKIFSEEGRNRVIQYFSR